MTSYFSRRDFMKTAGIGTVGLALGGPAFINKVFAQPSGRRTLRILQWSHFVPRYDRWFDPFVKKWGEEHNINVIINHISLSDLRSTFASEVVAGRGHDIVEFIDPPSDFEPSVLDLTDLNQEARRRFGAQVPFATRSSYNPDTKKYYGFCHGWTIDPGDYRKSLWQKVGKPDGPRTWEDLLVYAARIKRELGVQNGIGLSQELDTNMAGRALLWSFGTGTQDGRENVILDNRKTVEAVKFMANLYDQTLTPEVFGWTPASNNQLLIAGRASYILNSISAYRSAQKDVPEIAKDIYFSPALKGPEGIGWACEHVIYVSVIPKFAAANADIAKQFLLDLSANYDRAMWESELYASPAFFNTPVLSGDRGYPRVSGAKKLRDLYSHWFANDPYALPGEARGKLLPLMDAEKWATNVGHPGPANPAEGEIFGTFIIPNMFARVAQRQQRAEESVKQASAECRKIFDKWRAKGL
ncbi:MAG: substrate-binding domain-containing protein, partial [Geobacteraceae bacterium]|nr:substrate-binding domain-containing protein [Geobacteraceae bacterium]